MRRLVLLLLACPLALAACSDDTPPATDSGAAADQKQAPEDGMPMFPDGPKKPASWAMIPGSAPAVYSHTATALADGRVLIAGGFYKDKGQSESPRAITYLFAPKTNTFKHAGDLKTARGGHGAMLLNGGRVLVFGGRQSTYKVLASAELFDPKKGAWSAAGSMTVPRTSHAAVKMKDGNVLALGGVGKEAWQPHKSLEVFKPQSNSWSVLGLALAKGRALASATSLNSGKVIIAGGYDGKAWMDSVVTFDPKAGTLAIQNTKLGEARCAHSATLTGNGRVLLVGGTCGTSCDLKGNELYNPTTGKVTSVSHSGSPPNNHRAVGLSDGRVLVTGGSALKGLTKAVVFEAAGVGSWTTLPSMKHGRASHSATLLPDGSVLVVGGEAGGLAVNKAERLHNP